AWHVDRYDCALACRLPGESTVPGNAEAPRIGGYILVLQRRSIVDHHFSRPASPRNQGTFAGRDHKILDLAAPNERRPDDESENIVDCLSGMGPKQPRMSSFFSPHGRIGRTGFRAGPPPRCQSRKGCPLDGPTAAPGSTRS